MPRVAQQIQGTGSWSMHPSTHLIQDYTQRSATLLYFGGFGAPAQIRNNNGPHFTAEIMAWQFVNNFPG